MPGSYRVLTDEQSSRSTMRISQNTMKNSQIEYLLDILEAVHIC